MCDNTQIPLRKRALMSGLRRLKEQWEENPMAVMAITVAALTAASKFIDSISAVQGRRAYAKQINHRVRTKK